MNGVPVRAVSRPLGRSSAGITLTDAHPWDRDVEVAAEGIGPAQQQDAVVGVHRAAGVSGWIASSLPAIDTGENMRPYREWLPATSLDATLSLGGSFATGNVEDHHLTPYDLGCGFIGRTSLEAISPERKKKKVSLVWNDEDVVDIHASGLSKGERYKHLEMPSTNYATSHLDRVTLDGKTVGVSFYPVYSEFDRSWISLGAIPADLAVDCHELTVVWGEPNGGSKKITVERHVQKDVRVTVDTSPVKRD